MFLPRFRPYISKIKIINTKTFLIKILQWYQVLITWLSQHYLQQFQTKFHAAISWEKTQKSHKKVEFHGVSIKDLLKKPQPTHWFTDIKETKEINDERKSCRRKNTFYSSVQQTDFSLELSFLGKMIVKLKIKILINCF